MEGIEKDRRVPHKLPRSPRRAPHTHLLLTHRLPQDPHLSQPPNVTTYLHLSEYSICRQITVEALQEFYSHNTFCATDHYECGPKLAPGLLHKSRQVKCHIHRPPGFPRAVEPKYAHLVRELRYVVPSEKYFCDPKAIDYQLGHPSFDRKCISGEINEPTLIKIQQEITDLVKRKLDMSISGSGETPKEIPDWVEFEFTVRKTSLESSQGLWGLDW
ncbi:uncharacterized protein BDZ99DRAFT_482184 [Mytilinidion resinicola]|uniref:Uncharacterized protein n=1 Tax=Mytilinidion resinicola TaxID=574789 RepID=A0A6A6Y6B0_9PEZI|nr:uncharacterized protein BDZ99DRAFT_482184 [Mytilinidion resinicola]KAF2803337.1 hypothetical protein BDZ99DRAFT_482184 [Mytilinidion resinicola]